MTSYVDDNAFPKIIATEGSAPAAPASGKQSLFIDSADHKLKRESSSGVIISLEDLVSTKAASYSVVAADNKTTFIANAASLVFTLPAPATVGAGFWIEIKNNNQTTTGYKTNTAGVLVDGVDYSASAGTTGLTTAYGSVRIKTDGTNWYTTATDGGSGSGSSTLSGDSDVSFSGLAALDQMQYNGSAWINAKGGMVRLNKQVLGSAVATISFTSIPSTYSSLILELEGRGDTSATLVAVNLTFNSDTGANYDVAYIDANTPSAPTSSQSFANASMTGAGILTAATATANLSGFARMVFPNYAGTTFQKNMQSDIVWKSDNTATYRLRRLNGAWRSTAAIIRIDLETAAGNFVIGTTATLWGQA